MLNNIKIGDVVIYDGIIIYSEDIVLNIGNNKHDKYTVASWSHYKDSSNYELIIKNYSEKYFHTQFYKSPFSHFCKVENLYYFFKQFEEIYIIGVNQTSCKPFEDILYCDVIYFQVDGKYLEVFMTRYQQDTEEVQNHYVWINQYDLAEELHILFEYNYLFKNGYKKCTIFNLSEDILSKNNFNGIAFYLDEIPVLSIYKNKKYDRNFKDGILAFSKYFNYISDVEKFKLEI